MFCAKVEPMVRGLAKDYEGRMRFEIKDYKKDDSPDLITKYELDKHGMVITDSAGKLLWKESGHKQQRDVVAKAIDGLLASK